MLRSQRALQKAKGRLYGGQERRVQSSLNINENVKEVACSEHNSEEEGGRQGGRL